MAASKPPVVTPSGLPTRIWIVTRPTGERDFLYRKPLEGVAAWAKGLNATVAEYRFAAVVHVPPKKAKNP